MDDRTWPDFLAPADLDFLRHARVGHLATLGADAFPLVLPVCFALLDDPAPAMVSVLDDKPKSVPDTRLGRVRNIARHPRVGFTIDGYDEDWSRLWSIQVRGEARLADPDDPVHAPGLAALRAKYPQYRTMDLAARPMIVIAPVRARAWHATPPAA